ncbi:MAG: PorP/SprF family type IX secretion system membrane protein [Bacteroidales bacterium]
MRRKIIYSILGYLFVLTVNSASAQTFVPVFSQQMLSNVNFNPAAVSENDYVEGFLHARQQWTGFTGAPMSQMLNLQGYISEIKSGIAASVVTEFMGKNFSLNAKFSYSYHFYLGKKNYLSLGLAAGVLYKNFKGTELILEDGNDPYIEMRNVNDVKPDLDFGITFTSGDFCIGASVTHLTAFAFHKDDYFSPTAAYYLFAQYKGNISKKFALDPYVRAYYVDNNFRLDVNLVARFLDIFWIGAGYRLNDAALLMAGVRIGKVFTLGYSYDFSLGPIKKYNSGSHEIVLGLRFQANRKVGDVTQTPRYFE